MRKQQGFTLIEVLVVLSLLSILLLFTGNVLKNATSTTQQIQQRTGRLDEVLAAHRYFNGVISRALPLAIKSHADGALLFVGKPTYMALVSTLPASIGGGIYVNELDSDSNGIRVRFSRPQFMGETAPDSQRVLTNVTHLRFSYRGISPQGKPSEWLDNWPWSDTLPRSIRIDMQLDGPVSWTTQVVTLRQQLSGSNGT